MKTIRNVLYGVLVLLYLLHNDLWFWNDPTLIFSLPAGLFYHLLFCAAASVLMYFLVNYAWPGNLAKSGEETSK